MHLNIVYNQFFFFFNYTATTEIYTLSLHDALPISIPLACHRRASTDCFCVWPTKLLQGGCHFQVTAKRISHPHLLWRTDRKSTRLNSSHLVISYAVFCLKKKKNLTQMCPNAYLTVA